MISLKENILQDKKAYKIIFTFKFIQKAWNGNKNKKKWKFNNNNNNNNRRIIEKINK